MTAACEQPGPVGDPVVRDRAGAAQLEQLPADQPVGGLGLLDRARGHDPVVDTAKADRVLVRDGRHDRIVDHGHLVPCPPETLYGPSTVNRMGAGIRGLVSGGG